MLAGETCSTIFAPWSLAFSRNRMMLLVRMLTETFQVLRSNYNNLIEFAFTNRNIVKHFAWALWSSAINFSFLDIIEEMIFKAMSTKALRTWANRSTVLSIAVSEVYIQPIFPGFTHLILELFELLLIHHFPIVCISHNTICTLIFSSYSTYLTYSKYACTCFAASPPITNLSICLSIF